MAMGYNYHRAFVPGDHRAPFVLCFCSRLLCFRPPVPSRNRAATLTIDLAQVKAKASPQLYGLMTEEINYSYDGGLYAELVRNRTFQDRGKIPPSWFLYEWGSADASMAIDRTTGPSAALPLSLQLTVKSAERSRPGRHQQPGVLGLSRTGRKPPITVRSMPRRAIPRSEPVTVSLVEDETGKAISTTVPALTTAWQQHEFTLHSGAAAKSSQYHLVLSVG